MVKGDIIYFSVNNWFCGEDFPPTPNFYKWISGSNSDECFRNGEWCKKNKLCVYWGYIDMSVNYTVAAPREWVEENCPELLTDGEFTYKIAHYRGNENIIEDCIKKYSDFVFNLEDGGMPDSDRNDMPFPEYCEDNFGSEYYNMHWFEYDEEYDDEDIEHYGEDKDN